MSINILLKPKNIMLCIRTSHYLLPYCVIYHQKQQKFVHQDSKPKCDSIDTFVSELLNNKSNRWKQCDNNRIKKNKINIVNNEKEQVSSNNNTTELSTVNISSDIEVLILLYKKGENIQALILCEELYNKQIELRRDIRKFLRYILPDLVYKHSEAGLVKSKELVIKLSKVYDDFRPIVTLWYVCFLSNWFSDQQVSLELLNIIIIEGKMKVLEQRMMVAVFAALTKNQTDIIYSLLEILLKYELMKHYELVLSALFDYKCANGDLRSCSSIIKTAIDMNIMLTSQQHTRFLDLLCSKRKMNWFDNSKTDKKPITNNEPKLPPPFELKF